MDKFSIKVEKGIPIEGNPRNAKYPWNELEVGDSFLVEAKHSGKVSGGIHRRNLDDSKHFVSRRVDADHYRIWRDR
jgi:hypothetical protein